MEIVGDDPKKKGRLAKESLTLTKKPRQEEIVTGYREEYLAKTRFETVLPSESLRSSVPDPRVYLSLIPSRVRYFVFPLTSITRSTLSQSWFLCRCVTQLDFTRPVSPFFTYPQFSNHSFLSSYLGFQIFRPTLGLVFLKSFTSIDSVRT